MEKYFQYPTSGASKKASDYKLWQPAFDVNVFCVESVLDKELKVEAAIHIQRAFREHLAVEASQSISSQGTDHPACCKCGAQFGAQTNSDYEGDACDICGDYFHT